MMALWTFDRARIGRLAFPAAEWGDFYTWQCAHGAGGLLSDYGFVIFYRGQTPAVNDLSMVKPSR